MEKRWVIKEQGAPDKVREMAKELNVSEIIANLLVQRNITTYEEARVFFRPQLSDLHDPFLMKDMDKAIDRLDKAIRLNQRILVYGDYDVDGTTAVALVYSFLRKRHQRLGYYVPDRYNEGYGVSFQGIDYAVENSYDLIIALDCGIKAIDKAEYAKNNGIDLIICDHHNPDETLPNAVAVLDPKRKDCDYPYKELSGCGVGFKLIQGYCQYKKIDEAEINRYLDLVVVSIGSDIVPITGENRILAHYGLLQLNSSPCIGLKSIIDLSGLNDTEIQINDIVFKIGPRINAAGRMESGSRAVELLISENAKIAETNAAEINLINSDRKELDHSITDQALAQIEENVDLKHLKSTVVYEPHWHKGVIGIVASRLTETYYRPTVVLTLSNGLVTGSARSVPGYNLYNAIESCSDLLENFGGHMYAAGLSMKLENVEIFKQRFEEYVSNTIEDHMLTPSILIDSKLEIKDITPKFYRILKQFAPFGPENMMPMFMSENIYDNGSVRKVGKTEDHLKLRIIQQLGANLCIEGIAFNFGYMYNKIKDYQQFSVCYHVFENNFMGQSLIQLMIKDIKVR
ncbi:MAG: single-stranded-DNA-specific exonuclease RecJ [Bacteroidales bacterium]|nr:single-stranded-DNA-specific exonuclease RecJ [Bacteroidales bacterium]